MKRIFLPNVCRVECYYDELFDEYSFELSWRKVVNDTTEEYIPIETVIYPATSVQKWNGSRIPLPEDLSVDVGDPREDSHSQTQADKAMEKD